MSDHPNKHGREALEYAGYGVTALPMGQGYNSLGSNSALNLDQTRLSEETGVHI